MRLKSLSGLLIACLVSVQTIAAVGQAPAPVERTLPPATAFLTIPAGTVVPLTLVSPIRTRSTKPGDTVRAQVAFPVTIGTSLAIPAGTYVEGTVQSVITKKTKTNTGGLQIHFTQLIYANGYKVPLDAVNSHAEVTMPGTPIPQVPEMTSVNVGLGTGLGIGLQPVAFPSGLRPMLMGQNPTLPPLPPLPGPPRSFLVFAAIGAALAVASIIFFAYLAHRGNRADFVAYDSGWQFQMALTVPVTVDSGQVNAAASLAPQ